MDKHTCQTALQTDWCDEKVNNPGRAQGAFNEIHGVTAPDHVKVKKSRGPSLDLNPILIPRQLQMIVLMRGFEE